MRLGILTWALHGVDASFAERLTTPLREAGIDAALIPLEAPERLAGFDAATPLLCWSYHSDPNLWRSRLAAVEASGVQVINPPALLTWNTEKTYLRQLEAAGVAVVPTRFVDVVTQADVDATRAAFGCETIVLKPQVSGGSKQTLKLAVGDSLEGGPTGPAMIQPFLASVGAEGELSVFMFGGRFSHAVTKVAASGDFRVQPRFGAAITAIDPTVEALEIADRVLAAAPHTATYARVDLVRDKENRLLLMELEVIEPDLYLQYAPDHGKAFAKAMIEAMRR